MEHSSNAYGLAAVDDSGVLTSFHFSRRAKRDEDVILKILYCGICHSDLHIARNDWQNSTFPVVPGHEIIGEVTAVGSKVTQFKVGDKAGVGSMVGSCRTCPECNDNLENYCSEVVYSFSSVDFSGKVTHGGFSDTIVVDQHFVVQIPDSLPLAAAAPLLCAGITVYSPLRHFGLDKPDLHVGVVGLGGLGHVAVKFAKAFGAKVTIISTSPSKKQEAIERLGADAFLISKDPNQIKASTKTMDGIVDTVSAAHPITPLLSLLKTNGKLVLVGVPHRPFELAAFSVILGRKTVAGSGIGGMKETQEMLEFAAENNITADIELIPADYVNTAMERLGKADVRYRFVIDIANTLKAPSNL